MLNYKLILLILGVLLFIEGAFITICSLISAIYGENDFFALTISALIVFFVGFLLYIFNRKTKKEVSKREAYLIVTGGWLILSLFGALPFYISRYIPSYTNAFFETISGFTTTGASILNNIEALPRGLLLWRSTTQWIGGMGIIVFSIAIVSFIKIGGMQLFNAEVPGVEKDKLHPKIRQTAKKLWMIYFFLTLAETFLLVFGGMSVFDAVNHSLTTMATGGFSTKQASIAYWNSPYIHYVITVFMILAGTNFSLTYYAFTGKLKRVFNNSEFKFYLLVIFVATVIIAVGQFAFMHRPAEFSFRSAIFQVVSIITTTGYATDDYLLWVPKGLWVIILLLMFFGGCSGSTSGSIKIVRIHILLRNSYTEFKRVLLPHAVVPVKYNKHVISNNIINNILAFVILYMMIFAIGTVFLSFSGLDFESALGAVATCLGNIGPGIGSVGPSSNFYHITDAGKWFLSALMLIGRLELFTVLILFTKAFWRY